MFYVYVLKRLSGFFGTRSGLFWRTQHRSATLIITIQLRSGNVVKIFLQNSSGNNMLDVNQYWSPNLYNDKRGAPKKV